MQKKYRLTSSHGFDYLYKKGASVKNGTLVLFYAKSKYSTPKVGFSVGKKVGGSVIRNRTKRRLKEAFRSEINNVKTGYNYLVVARSGSGECDYITLKQSLCALMVQAGMLDGVAAEG